MAFNSLQRWEFYQVGRATLSLVTEQPTPGNIPLEPLPPGIHTTPSDRTKPAENPSTVQSTSGLGSRGPPRSPCANPGGDPREHDRE